MPRHQSAWQHLKNTLKINTIITARIVCFYPQGVMLDIGQGFYGVADYQACKDKLGADKLYPHHTLDVAVRAFMDEYLWVKVAVI